MAFPHGMWDPHGSSERPWKWEQTLKKGNGPHPPLSPAPSSTSSVLTPGSLQCHLHTGAKDKEFLSLWGTEAVPATRSVISRDLP